MSKNTITVGAYVAFHSKKGLLTFSTPALRKGGSLAPMVKGTQITLFVDGEEIASGPNHDTSLISVNCSAEQAAKVVPGMTLDVETE